MVSDEVHRERPHIIASRNIFALFQESQFWPPKDLQAFQRSQLEQLLRHAKAQVPFYESRLDVLFRKDNSIDWDRWSELPRLDRNDLLHHQQDMQARELPHGHGTVRTESTSGTTARFITVSHTWLEDRVIEANGWRSYLWQGLDPRSSMLMWMGNELDQAVYPEGELLGQWAAPWLPPEEKGPFWRLNRGTNTENVLQFIVDKKIDHFKGRPESAHALALAAKRLGIVVPLQSIQTMSATVTQTQREDCHRYLKSEIGASYSSKEGARMAYSCPHSQLYHVNAESVLLEILRPDGTPCADGETGEIVITPFYNAAQPLIRYAHGDVAVAGGRCTCGRTLPVFRQVVGRQFHLFRFPDGKTIAPWVPHVERSLLGTRLLQVAQIGEWDVEIRYVPESPTPEAQKARFVELARRHIHQNCRISLVAVPELPLSPSGKFLEYVNETAARPN